MNVYWRTPRGYNSSQLSFLRIYYGMARALRVSTNRIIDNYPLLEVGSPNLLLRIQKEPSNYLSNALPCGRVTLLKPCSPISHSLCNVSMHTVEIDISAHWKDKSGGAGSLGNLE